MSTEAIVAPSKPALKRPPLYKVMIFDDDVSTFQCVIDLMVNYFNTSEDDAYRFAYKINIEGNATAGTYPKDIAETKVKLAKDELISNGYPLRIELFESK